MTSTALVWRWTLFLDSVSGSIREVDYIYHPSRGGEHVQIDFVPADLLQWAFSEGEQAFILESVSSALVVPEGQMLRTFGVPKANVGDRFLTRDACLTDVCTVRTLR